VTARPLASRVFYCVRVRGGGAQDGGRRLTPSTFRNDAIAAVTRVTRRHVVAFVSDHNTQTDVATEIFRLEAPPYQGPASATHTPGP
jgi:hypothetical protein